MQLLESYRDQNGDSRHRVILSLGSLKIPEEDRPIIARGVEQKLFGAQELIPADLSASQQRWIDDLTRRIQRQGHWKSALPRTDPAPPRSSVGVVEVALDQLEHEQATVLGPCLAGWHTWRELQLDQALERCGFNKAQSVVAAVSVINRLVEPVSEHALVEWLPNSSLPELLGNEVERGGVDRFYRVSDHLLKHRQDLEKHLRMRHGALGHLDQTILLYDLTNTHFEGECAGNPQARRGKNKQHRNDCPQVTVGMVFDRQGYELAHEVWEGNLSDSKSLQKMLERLARVREESDLPAGSPLVVMDAGIANRKNLDLLKAQHYRYLVNDSRRGRKRYAEEFKQREEFKLVSDRSQASAVRVRKTIEPQTGETLILCYSENRKAKEEAMRSSAEARYLGELEKLAQRLRKKQLSDPVKIQRAIGRIQSRHGRVQRYYRVSYHEGDLEWTRRDEPWEADELLLGCYVLRTEQTDLSAEELWRLYMTLLQAEEGFKALKSDLGLRPNFHQIQTRVAAHIFITVLAHHLQRTMLRKLEQQQDDRSWITIRRVLQTHCYATIILPTRQGDTYRIRKAGQPEESQKRIYRLLGVDWRNLPTIKTLISKS